MDEDQSSCPFLQRPLKRGQGRSHRRSNRLRGLRLYQPQLGVRAWDEKVYLQTLLITKIVEFLAHATVDLTLEYFRRYEAFKQNPKKWRALKLSYGGQTQQIASQAGVAELNFRRLNQPLPEVFAIGR